MQIKNQIVLGYLIPALLLAVLSAIYIPLYTSHDVYGYDEADYMFAESKGLAANYMDAPALSIRTFVQSGLSMGTDRHKRTELSELIRASGDIPFYRHYHAPLYIYWLRVAEILGAKQESDFRFASFLLFAVTGVVLLWGAHTLGGDRWPSIWLPLIFLLGCETNLLTAASLTPHAMFTVTSLAALVMFSKFLRTRTPRDWYLSLVFLALAFLSIEYAVLVAATFVLCLFISRKTLSLVQGHFLKFTLRAVAVLLIVIGLCWLGGIVKLTLIKNYIFFTYFTIVRGGEYGTGTAASAWMERFASAPFLWAVAALTLLYALIYLRKRRDLLPLAIYPVLLVLTTLRNTSTSPTYVSSLLPPLFLLAGIVASELIRPGRMVISVVVIAVCVAGSALSLHPANQARARTQEREHPSTNQRLITYLTDRGAEDSTIVVPRAFLPTLHYYFQTKRILAYALDDDSATMQGLLASRDVRGFLHAGMAQNSFEDLILTRFDVTRDTIRASVADTNRLIYYHLQHR